MANGGNHSLLEYLIAAGVAVGSAIGTAIAVVKARAAKKNGREIVTKFYLSDARRQIEEGARSDRHEIYNKIQALGAALEIDIQRVNDNIAQYVKSNEERMREQKREHDERIREIELELARQGRPRRG